MVQIYIINLLDRKDRLENTLKELEKVGVQTKNIHIIEAVDTRSASYDEIKMRFPDIKSKDLEAIKNGTRAEHFQLTSGAIGCFYSHIKAWEAILAFPNSNESSVILEDDIRFTNYFKAREYVVGHKLENKMKSANIFLLSHTGFHKDHSVLANLQFHEYPEEIVSDFFMGLQSYSLSKSTAKLLLQHLRIPSKQVDWSISDMIKSHKLVVKALVHRISKVTEIDSDIQLDQPCLKAW